MLAIVIQANFDNGNAPFGLLHNGSTVVQKSGKFQGHGWCLGDAERSAALLSCRFDFVTQTLGQPGVDLLYCDSALDQGPTLVTEYKVHVVDYIVLCGDVDLCLARIR